MKSKFAEDIIQYLIHYVFCLSVLGVIFFVADERVQAQNSSVQTKTPTAEQQQAAEYVAMAWHNTRQTKHRALIKEKSYSLVEGREKNKSKEESEVKFENVNSLKVESKFEVVALSGNKNTIQFNYVLNGGKGFKLFSSLSSWVEIQPSDIPYPKFLDDSANNVSENFRNGFYTQFDGEENYQGSPVKRFKLSVKTALLDYSETVLINNANLVVHYQTSQLREQTSTIPPSKMHSETIAEFQYDAEFSVQPPKNYQSFEEREKAIERLLKGIKRKKKADQN